MSLSVPNYAQGFAHSAGEAANPGLWQGLVGAWAPSLGKTGAILFDQSGFRADGTISGATWIMTKYGWALDFNKAGTVTTGKTFNTTRFSYAMQIFGNDPGIDNAYVLFEGTADGRSFGIWGSTYDEWVVWNGHLRQAVTYGVWKSIVYTYDGTNGRLYIDGKLADTEAYVPAAGGNLVIGDYGGGSYGWDGFIGNVSIWDRALALNEAQQLYVDPNALFQLRPRRVFKAPVAAGLSIPIAMHHYKQLQGAN